MGLLSSMGHKVSHETSHGPFGEVSMGLWGLKRVLFLGCPRWTKLKDFGRVDSKRSRWLSKNGSKKAKKRDFPRGQVLNRDVKSFDCVGKSAKCDFPGVQTQKITILLKNPMPSSLMFPM